MSSTVLRLFAVLLAIGALVIGYLGYQASQPKPNLPVAVQPEAPVAVTQYEVAVAARPIAAGQTLVADDIKLIETEQRIDYANNHLNDLIGKRTRLSIDEGDLVLDEHFHEVSPVVAAISEGQRAIAVRVDEVTGTGGFIEPGDKVDVLLFLAAGQENDRTSSAQRILTSVRVLAYGDDVDQIDRKAIKQKAQLERQSATSETAKTPDKDPQAASGKKSKTAVLAVAEKDLSSLLLAESSGSLRLALVGSELAQEASPLASLLEQQKAAQQWVSLDEFKPKQAAPQKKATPVSRPVSNSSSVTVMRGSQTSTVSVSKGE